MIVRLKLNVIDSLYLEIKPVMTNMYCSGFIIHVRAKTSVIVDQLTILIFLIEYKTLLFTE